MHWFAVTAPNTTIINDTNNGGLLIRTNLTKKKKNRMTSRKGTVLQTRMPNVRTLIHAPWRKKRIYYHLPQQCHRLKTCNNRYTPWHRKKLSSPTIYIYQPNVFVQTIYSLIPCIRPVGYIISRVPFIHLFFFFTAVVVHRVEASTLTVNPRPHPQPSALLCPGTNPAIHRCI